MTTFYDRGAVRITEQWLSIDNRSYRIGQLHNLRRARGRADHTTWRTASIAALSLPVIVAIATYIPAPTTLSVVVFVALPSAVATLRARLLSRPHLLWADYQGSPVQLYESRDEIEFGKISRALIRATNLASR
jgi:hypothetical protein